MADLKAVALLFPVAVVVECNTAISFSILGFDDDGRDFAKSFEDLAYGAFVFRCQGMSK
jgi:hypothetical protein